MVSNETVTTDEQQHSTPDSPLSEELCGASLPYPQSQIDGDDEFLQTVESCLYMVISHIKETSAQDTSMSSFGERSVHTNNDSSNRNSLNSVRSTGSQSLDEKMDDHCIESFPAAGSRLDPVIFIDNEVNDPSSDTSFEQKGACSWSPRNEILYNHCTHRINLVGEED